MNNDTIVNDNEKNNLTLKHDDNNLEISMFHIHFILLYMKTYC